jgi:hypothetical protein
VSWGGPTTHLERRIAAMTATRPRHRLSRTLAAAAATGCLLAAACDVVESKGASFDARNPAVPRVEEGIDENGRPYRYTDFPDGTTMVQVGPDPNAPPMGELGLSWGADYPGGWRPGEPRTVYPHVRQVRAGSPAAAAELQVNDIILSSNGKDGRLGNIFPDRTPGTVYTLRLRRNGVEREARLTVGPALPPEEPFGFAGSASPR